MGGIISILQDIARPLSAELLLVAVISGLLFGAFYNHVVDVPRKFVYHKFTAGIWFIIVVYLFRVLQNILNNTPQQSPAGWIGIALLWGIYCLFIWVGQTVRGDKSD